jgi:hypothetical protein
MRCFLFCLAAACSCWAQQNASDAALLANIKARMAENLLRLPNYTCAQTIERLRRRSHARPFERVDTVRLEVALVEGQEMFGWRGAKKIAETDPGRLVSGDGAIGNGNFALLARSVFLSHAVEFAYKGHAKREGVECFRFDYRVPVAASSYHLRKTPLKHTEDSVVGYHGSFWADARTLDLLRLNISADDIPEELGLSGVTDTLDYARARIGDSDFLLPHSAELTLSELSGAESRNRTLFDGCRQYMGESVVSFEDSAEALARSSVPAPTVAPLALPDDFEADIALETRIDSASAVGEEVHARLLRKVKAAPKGAMLKGYITRLYRDDGCYRIGIAFTDMDSGAGHADLEQRQNALFLSAGFRAMALAPVFRPMQRGFRGAGPSGEQQLTVPGRRLDLKPGYRMTLRSRLLQSEHP